MSEEREKEKQMNDFKFLCFDQKDVKACLNLSIMLGNETRFKDAAKVAYYCCDNLKSVECCRKVASNYYVGNGVPQNCERAAQYWKDLCDKGCTQSCKDLGKWYLSKKNDKNQAKTFLHKSCDVKENPSQQGCILLASVYDAGTKERLEYADKACSLGAVYGCRSMFHHYSSLSGQDNKMQALKYAKKGCNLNSVNECEVLRAFYSASKDAKAITRANYYKHRIDKLKSRDVLNL